MYTPRRLTYQDRLAFEAANLQGHNLLTFRRLKQLSDAGLDQGRFEIYLALQRMARETHYTKFISFRFRKYLANFDDAKEAHRKIKHKVNKFLFRKNTSHLKFLFIGETDWNRKSPSENYHFHFLVSGVAPDTIRLQNAPKSVRLYFDGVKLVKYVLNDNYDAPIRLEHFGVKKSNIREKILTDPFDRILFVKTANTQLEFTPNNNSVGAAIIEDVYDQEPLADYVFKRLGRSYSALNIDYENSDMSSLTWKPWRESTD